MRRAPRWDRSRDVEQGFEVRGVLGNDLYDESAGGYSALIIWEADRA